MKLIYQQMLAFFVVIITLLVILGASFFHLMRENVYQSTWQQMETYAYSLKSTSLKLVDTSKGEQIALNVSNLEISELLLQNQKVHFTIYTGRDKVLYPLDGFQSVISKTDWQKLQAGQILRRRKDIGDRKKVNQKQLSTSQKKLSSAQKQLPNWGKQVITTDVFVPCFNSQGKLVAVISVGAMVSNIESSIKEIQKSLIYALLVSALLGILISYI